MTRHCTCRPPRQSKPLPSDDRIVVGFFSTMGAALITLSVFSGCSAREFAQSPASDADIHREPDAGIPIRGEPEHLNAAVRYAASRHGLAVTSISDTDDGRIFELVSVRDEPARVWVTGLAELDGGEAGELWVRCRIGRFGSPAREREFEAAIGRRMAEKAPG